MKYFENKLTPKNLFVTALNVEELKIRVGDEAAERVKRNKTSGNEFIDVLARLMNANMIHSVRFYEDKMGLGTGDMNKFLRLYSGMPFKEWCNEYLLLAAKELLLETDYELAVIGRRIGFSGIHTFSQWFIRISGEAPSGWRRYVQHKRKREEAELFLKFKRDLRAGELIES